MIEAEARDFGATAGVFAAGAFAVEVDGFEAPAEGGLVVAARLCLAVRGVRLTPSETEARGRAAAAAEGAAPAGLPFAVVPTGDTTPRALVVVEAVVGFELAEDESEGFVIGGAEGFVGTTDALRAGAAAGVAAGLADAIAGLAVEAVPLVDFFRGAAAGFGAPDAEEGAGLDETDLPAPKVPELSIYEKTKIRHVGKK